MAGVRDDAPWCPWNIEFIRRVNGLDSVDDVYATVFDAEYLVLGLGDVYLGAPVATPLDPRHRLVTTKYNPARTWTAENSVGIGGAYLCIYGMEGPGGYQFVGRTTQVWSGWQQQRGAFEQGSPWLLRFFDRIKWYPVEPDELLELPRRHHLRPLRPPHRGGHVLPRRVRGVPHRTRRLHRGVQVTPADRVRRGTRSLGSGGRVHPSGGGSRPGSPAGRGDGTRRGRLVEAEFAASVWQVNVAPGDEVAAGQPLLALEAMKMESRVHAPMAGVVTEILARPGDQVEAGTALLVLAPAS